MKALVLESNGKLMYRDVPLPPVSGDKKILVKITHSGICGSDIPRGFMEKAYHYPLIMGHEFSGVVAEAPEDASYRRGEKVTVFPLIPCMHCKACQTGNYAQCKDYDYYGSRRDGGFAEYVRVGEFNLFRIPDHVDPVSAAMTEPCAVALHGVEKLHISAGMRGLVIGGGPIGTMAAQWMKLKGVSPVYIADIDSRKLKIAEELGLRAINSSESVPVEAMQSSGGADCVIEACGLPATFTQAVESAARFGQVVFMGNIHGIFSLPEKKFSTILRNELTIRGTWNSKITPRGKDDWSRALHFMDREIKVQPLISHQPALSQGANVFDDIYKNRIWYNKIVFDLSGPGAHNT